MQISNTLEIGKHESPEKRTKKKTNRKKRKEKTENHDFTVYQSHALVSRQTKK